MSKISDMFISAILKRGILYEARNVDIDFEIPSETKSIKINLKAEHMKLTVEKETKNDKDAID